MWLKSTKSHPYILSNLDTVIYTETRHQHKHGGARLGATIQGLSSPDTTNSMLLKLPSWWLIVLCYWVWESDAEPSRPTSTNQGNHDSASRCCFANWTVNLVSALLRLKMKSSHKTKLSRQSRSGTRCLPSVSRPTPLLESDGNNNARNRRISSVNSRP